MTARRKERIAMARMAICAMMWSIAGIFIKQIDWNPFVIAGYRSLLGAGVLFVYMRATGQRLRISRNALINMVFMAGTFLAFISANKLTTAANAIVLQFTAPIFILLYAALFQRKPMAARDYVAVVCTFGGIAIFFMGGLKAGNLAGNAVAVLSGVLFAGIFLSVGGAKPEEKMSGMLLGHLLTAAVGIPVSLLQPITPTPRAVVSLVILGIVQLGIPYILLGLASDSCPPLACCLIGALEPLLNPVWVFLFDGERPGVASLLGGVIVIASVTVHSILRDRSAAEAPAGETAG
ncbi:hypothetical protein SDC9_90244 [bioreactor metagenome]|uniref:EamA domain-containing protein n=1 Tax=bioreactor metagenome TaxID=1076179 RepID=A0A644ZS36_9ZZZZ